MTDPTQHLWPQTLAVLVGLIVGLWLHLRWHPLREFFSEAFSLLQRMPWLVIGLVVCYGLTVSPEPWTVPLDDPQWASLSLKSQLFHMLPHAGLGLAMMIQGLVPPWPLALGLPGLLVWLLLKSKVPVRRASQRQTSRLNHGRLPLALLMVVSWIWLLLEGVACLGVMPTWGSWIVHGLRLGMESFTMVLGQLSLITWVILRKESSAWDVEKSVEDVRERLQSRWLAVTVTAGLGLLWILAWRGVDPAEPGLAEFLVVEAAVLFAALPMVVAQVRGSLTFILARVMQVLRVTALPLLAWVISALAILVLVDFSGQSFLSLAGGSGFGRWAVRIFNALVLATMQSWLFLALVLTLLRHGFNAPARPAAGK